MFSYIFSCINFMKADFMKMPFSEDTFDAVYAVEATCHAPDAVCTLSDLGLTTKYVSCRPVMIIF